MFSATWAPTHFTIDWMTAHAAETWRYENPGRHSLATPRGAARQVSGGSAASGLTIYGNSVEQRESSPHTTHNLRNYVFLYVIITLFFKPDIQSEAPEIVYWARWFWAKLIGLDFVLCKRNAPTECGYKTTILNWLITTDKLWETKLCSGATLK